MNTRSIYYATNRKHKGDDQWNPKSYGKSYSSSGLENLRFGKVTVNVENQKIQEFVNKDVKFGTGDGEELSGYLAKCAKSATINAFEEKIDHQVADVDQKDAKFGSIAMFAELKELMMDTTDVIIYIHGFNVKWEEAVGSALSLQEMLSTSDVRDNEQNVQVILFSWPSDGKALPFGSYKSDRTDAKNAGKSFGRGLLKVRDFLMKLKRKELPGGEELCGQDIHLLCHSMGNYVLQNTIKRIAQFTSGSALPRLFEHIFLCAPDVDDDVLESSKPMDRIHELARNVTVYHNKGDVAMYISDYTKSNPERLGCNGASRPFLLHNKVHQVNCTPIIKGLTEHSYYLCGNVSRDIRLSIDGKEFDDDARLRKRDSDMPNVWTMKKQ